MKQLKGAKRVVLPLAVLALFLCSWHPVSWVFSRVLEAPYPVRQIPSDDTQAQAIVVLASAVYPPSPPLPASRVGSDTFERCQYAAWLHKNWQHLPILASGGGNRDSGLPPYSVTMREALKTQGVPESMIWSEEQSHSTYENALYSAQMLKSKGIHKIVLVTEAYHMLRAEKCYRKQGLQVVPAACAYRANGFIHLSEVLPSWEAIAFNEDSLHEFVGLIWYGIRGWI